MNVPPEDPVHEFLGCFLTTENRIDQPEERAQECRNYAAYIVFILGNTLGSSRSRLPTFSIFIGVHKNWYMYVQSDRGHDKWYTCNLIFVQNDCVYNDIRAYWSITDRQNWYTVVCILIKYINFYNSLLKIVGTGGGGRTFRGLLIPYQGCSCRHKKWFISEMK